MPVRCVSFKKDVDSWLNSLPRGEVSNFINDLIHNRIKDDLDPKTLKMKISECHDTISLSEKNMIIYQNKLSAIHENNKELSKKEERVRMKEMVESEKLNRKEEMKKKMIRNPRLIRLIGDCLATDLDINITWDKAFDAGLVIKHDKELGSVGIMKKEFEEIYLCEKGKQMKK